MEPLDRVPAGVTAVFWQLASRLVEDAGNLFIYPNFVQISGTMLTTW